MAKARKTSQSSARKRASARKSAANDAVALLKSDHRQVEGWFEEFQSARADSRKETLAQKICLALKVHTQIEHEIFYPAFLEATGEEDIHHEAEVEHGAAKKLITEIEASTPSDDYYDAKVTVLSEMIKHHVNEEEKRDGMFAKARQSDMDLQALGEQLAARKARLMGSESESDERNSASRSPRDVAGEARREGLFRASARR